jgi:hypothetical protein
MLDAGADPTAELAYGGSNVLHLIENANRHDLGFLVDAARSAGVTDYR